MGIKERIVHTGAQLLLELRVSKLSYASLAAKLERSGRTLALRLVGMPDTARNRRQLGHIIGIERWGQSRLRVALGQPPLNDQYDGYCPPAATSWAELRQALQEARRDTLALVSQLHAAGISPGTRVRHNGFGEINLLAWLAYLDLHANMESKLIR